MGRHVIINTGIHSDPEFKALTATQQLLYFKLLSHPYGNKAGFFVLDSNYTAKILMGCSAAKLKTMLKTETDLWRYDEANDVVLLPNYLKYNKVAGSKTLTGLRYDLESLPKTKLCVEFIYKLYAYTEGAGMVYIPHQMLETAKALTKNQDTVLSTLVYKYITSL